MKKPRATDISAKGLIGTNIDFFGKVWYNGGIGGYRITAIMYPSQG